MHPPSIQRQAVTPAIAAVSLLTLLWYALFIFNADHIGHPVAYGLLVVAEVIGMLQLIGAWLTILLGGNQRPSPDARRIRESLLHAKEMPITIAVFIPVAGEPVDIIRETVSAARDMLVPHRTFILDDGRSDDVEALAAELGVEYLRRGDNAGWKAGNINHALDKIQPDFFAIFDSDHIAKQEFLLETLAYILTDEKLAFVQTPQQYYNSDNFIAAGSAQAQDVFYRHIQPAKNAFNASFYIGTNVLFRGDAIRDVGGFYQESHSEDIWTSILLHERGWKSYYLPVPLASGLAPETIDKYFRQQYRWATGGFEIFFHRPMKRKTMTLDQRLQYLHSSTFFFSGFAIAILFVLPLLYAYFGWKAIDAPEGGLAWAVRFFPYYAMTYASASHFMGQPIRWRTIVMALAPFPSHIAAFLTVLTGIRVGWVVSGVIRRKTDYIKSVAPHLLLLLLTVGAIPIMLGQSNVDLPLLFMSCFWLAWNALILASICKRAFPRFSESRAPFPVYQYAS